MTLDEFKIFTKENWDTEGAKAISIELFKASKIFIESHKGESVPECNPCSDGSIDWVFRCDFARLLINCKSKDGRYIASYYGDHNDDVNAIKGIIPLQLFYKPLYEWIKIFYQ